MSSKDDFPQFIGRENPDEETDTPDGTFRNPICSRKGIPYVAVTSQPGIVADVVSLNVNPLPVGNSTIPETGLVNASVNYAMEWNPIDNDVATMVNGYYPYAPTVPMETSGSESGPYSLTTISFLYAWSGIETAAANYVRLQAATGTNQAADTKTAPFQVATPGTWSITHAPAANTQATVSRASAGATARHICTAITATLVAPAGSASDVVQLNLRDGATGVGTILKSITLQVGGASSVSADRAIVQLSGLQVVGSEDTEMTLEFSATGGTNVLESVSMEGYDIER